MSFSGARFKKCRERAGYSQERLREEINRRLDPQEQIGHASIGAWENGRSKNPRALPLSVAAEVLGVSADDFDDTPADHKADSLADQEAQHEADRLARWGFVPGYFDFLESVLHCGIETHRVHYLDETHECIVEGFIEKCIVTNKIGDEQYRYLNHDVSDGIKVTDKASVKRAVLTDDIMRLGVEPGAVLHYTNKKDVDISLRDLYKLQHILTKVAYHILQEMLDDREGQQGLPEFLRDDEQFAPKKYWLGQC